MLARPELLGFIATSLAERPLEPSCRPSSLIVIGTHQRSHYDV